MDCEIKAHTYGRSRKDDQTPLGPNHKLEGQPDKHGILEGLNSIVQAAKARARGYRTFKNFKTIVYLTTGKLDFHTMNPHYRSLRGSVTH